METYKPNEPSGATFAEGVTRADQKLNVRRVNFGIQDAQRAQYFGLELARYEFGYEAAKAEIWREAWTCHPGVDFSRVVLPKRLRRPIGSQAERELNRTERLEKSGSHPLTLLVLRK